MNLNQYWPHVGGITALLMLRIPSKAQQCQQQALKNATKLVSLSPIAVSFVHSLPADGEKLTWCVLDVWVNIWLVILCALH